MTVKMDAAQIAYANVNDMQAVWDHPQLKALKRMVQTETPAGTVESFLPPGNNSSYEPTLGAVPRIGEHTRLILEELGFSVEQIEHFYADGVV